VRHVQLRLKTHILQQCDHQHRAHLISKNKIAQTPIFAVQVPPVRRHCLCSHGQTFGVQNEVLHLMQRGVQTQVRNGGYAPALACD